MAMELPDEAISYDYNGLLAPVLEDWSAAAELRTRHFVTPTGRAVTGGPTTPWTWELAEMFKLDKGKIHRIEAILERAPYGMDAGWSSWEDAMSDRARDVTGSR